MNFVKAVFHNILYVLFNNVIIAKLSKKLNYVMNLKQSSIIKKLKYKNIINFSCCNNNTYRNNI